MDGGDLAQYPEDIINRLANDSDGDLTNMMISDDVLDSDLYMDNEESVYNEPDDVIIVHMDIREELRTLQKLVEQKIGVDLTGYKFWLQDAQELEPHKNLVDQCVKGEGLVQINVQIQTINQRINIMDVLKPTEAALAALASVEKENSKRSEDNNIDDEDLDSDNNSNAGHDENSNPLFNGEGKPCVNWIRDQKFRREQSRLKIPEDPMLWEVSHVKHWFQWAVQEFNLTGYKLNDWSINGKELCSLTHEEFREKLPNDPGNVFYTHLQLLKECKFVSVVDKERENFVAEDNFYGVDNVNIPDDGYKIMRKSHFQKTKTVSNDLSNSNTSSMVMPVNAGVGSGNNGQIQLWQFLLDLLTDRSHCDIIQWVGVDGEFRLTDPERVARLWGIKKNKPAMNYEKLSRALRYYYDGDMISKVSGKRFAYKFDCDLKLLIGYDAGELSSLVNVKGVTTTDEFDSEVMKNDSE